MSDALEHSVNEFIARLQRRQVHGAYNVSQQTARVLRAVILQSQWVNAVQLLENIKEVGKRLIAASPSELCIGNVVRRALALVRDAAAVHSRVQDEGEDAIGSCASPDTRDSSVSPPARPSGAELPSEESLALRIAAVQPPPDSGGSTTGSSGSRADSPATLERSDEREHTDDLQRPNGEPDAEAEEAVSAGVAAAAHGPSTKASRADGPSPRSSMRGANSGAALAAAAALALRPAAVTHQRSIVDMFEHMQRLEEAPPPPSVDEGLGMKRFMQDYVLQELKELMDEIGGVARTIAEQAVVHVHARDAVLTYGKSFTVSEFLLGAKRIGRQFEVFVAEAEPTLLGREQARRLAVAGVRSTVITDSAVFALMPRISKVVLPVHGVLANGALICASGGRIIAEAAKYYNVPVLVVMGLHKLCPLFPTDPDEFCELIAPASVVRFDEDEFGDGSVLVPNPAYDYIPPELVTLYVTNVGTHTPSYIYRLINEYYSPEDADLA